MKNKAEGKKFPGFFATDIVYTKGHTRYDRVKVFLLPEDDTRLPGQFAQGFYLSKESSSDPDKAHVVAHFFDKDVLASLFRAAGFEIVELYSFGIYGQRLDNMDEARKEVREIQLKYPEHPVPQDWDKPARSVIRAKKLQVKP